LKDSVSFGRAGCLVVRRGSSMGRARRAAAVRFITWRASSLRSASAPSPPLSWYL
jgi:hypothetical protein